MKYHGTGDTLNATNQAARLRAVIAALEWDMHHMEGITDQMYGAASKRVDRMRKEAAEWDAKVKEWEASTTGWHS